ncbi:hypothetical protein PN4B1_41530 [Paenibacillus naphthalenovorans]|nr:hypothetical protein PN4B1_41530 [Paenibacillus naphthalenovorans]
MKDTIEHTKRINIQIEHRLVGFVSGIPFNIPFFVELELYIKLRKEVIVIILLMPSAVRNNRGGGIN